MAKRRRKSANRANLPQETLERARRQAAIERGELAPEELDKSVEPAEAAGDVAPPSKVEIPENPYKTASSRTRRVRSEARGVTRVTNTRTQRGDEPLDAETIADLLTNPTRIVSEEEMRAEYNYVLADLRSMGLLAAVLFVTLIVLAQVLPG